MNVEDIICQALIGQQGLEPGEALPIVDRVMSADADIRSSAECWARSGVFPDAPVIEGYSPLTLGQELRPSQVFTLLIELRSNPQGALHWLRRRRALSSARLIDDQHA